MASIELVNKQVGYWQGQRTNFGSLKNGLDNAIFWRMYKLTHFSHTLNNSQITSLSYEIRKFELSKTFLLPESDKHLFDVSCIRNIQADRDGRDIITYEHNGVLLKATESEFQDFLLKQKNKETPVIQNGSYKLS